MLNDAVSIFFADPRERIRRVVVCRHQGRDGEGRVQVREDEPATRTAASMHRAP